MTGDPFQAPKAPLETAPRPARERGPAPIGVKFGTRFLWTSATLVIVAQLTLAADLVAIPGRQGVTFIELAGNAVSCSVLAFFAWTISMGQNWARWIYAVFGGFGITAFAFVVFTTPTFWSAMPIALIALNVVQNFLQLSTIVLLFLPESSAWFTGRDTA
ncbi:hypothetical protein BWI17_12315 [Betaproteobacteria bacterium GR16-43]|nr:hypothetical protein BWI17_12315 [Betaproteobacteria bacterium GR16-43]